MGAAFGAGYLANLGYGSMSVAEGYALDLLNIVANRDLWVRTDRGNTITSGDPWYTSGPLGLSFKFADAGVLKLRDTLQNLGANWLMTGEEAIKVVRGLGYEYNRERARATALFSRQIGLAPGRVGDRYRRGRAQHGAGVGGWAKSVWRSDAIRSQVGVGAPLPPPSLRCGGGLPPQAGGLSS